MPVFCDGSGGGVFTWACTTPVASSKSERTKLDRIVCMSSLSAKERVAGRAVRAVDLRVAIDAAAPDQPVALRCERVGVVDRRGMLGADVAPLAQHRQLRHEHPIVVRP